MRAVSLTSLFMAVFFLGCGDQQAEIDKRVVNIKALLINPPLESVRMMNTAKEIVKNVDEIRRIHGFDEDYTDFMKKTLLDVAPMLESYFQRIAIESRKTNGVYRGLGLTESEEKCLVRLYNATLGSVNRRNQSFDEFDRELGFRWFRDVEWKHK